MEQEEKRSAAGESGFMRTMGRMRRTGIFYVLLAILMASCKSCSCDGCEEEVEEYFCNQWVKNTGCHQICEVRYQLIDQNGNNLTNVHSSTLLPIEIKNTTGTKTYFSKAVSFDANGSSGNQGLTSGCINPCDEDMSGNPFNITAAGLVKVVDPSCPPTLGGCRFWGMSGGSGDVSYGFEGCVVVVKIRVVPMNICGPC